MTSHTYANPASRVAAAALTAETRGEPVHVYVCSCRVCQIKSGSAFTYAALFSGDDVAVRGAHKAWRHIGDSGRWVENHFCPQCGITVFFYSEGFAGAIGVPVGGFAEDNRGRDGRSAHAAANVLGLTQARLGAGAGGRGGAGGAVGERPYPCAVCWGAVSLTAIIQPIGSSTTSVPKKASRLSMSWMCGSLSTTSPTTTAATMEITAITKNVASNVKPCIFASRKLIRI